MTAARFANSARPHLPPVRPGDRADDPGERSLLTLQGQQLGQLGDVGCDPPGLVVREVRLMRVLTDRGSEYCGNPERHEYELYLAVEDVAPHARDRLFGLVL